MSTTTTKTETTIKVVCYNFFTVTSKNQEVVLTDVLNECNSGVTNIILCLQHVSRYILDTIGRELTANKFFRAMEYNPSGEYFHLIFTKMKIIKAEPVNLPLESIQPLKVILEPIGSDTGTSSTDRFTIVVGELNKNITSRKKQISVLNHLLVKTNIDFAVPENRTPVVCCLFTYITGYQRYITHPTGWKDAWLENGTEKNMYTEDYKKNSLVSPPTQERYQRVWYTSPDETFTLQEIQVLKKETNNLPSFGVVTIFKKT